MELAIMFSSFSNGISGCIYLYRRIAAHVHRIGYEQISCFSDCILFMYCNKKQGEKKN